MLALLLPACSSLAPHEVTITREEIERLIGREFPLQRRLLELFDVTVPAPALRLVPEHDSIVAEIDLQWQERLGGRVSPARLVVESSLRWQRSDQSLRLLNVHVLDLSLRQPGLPGRNRAEQLGALVAETMLEGARLYRLTADRQQRLQQFGLTPSTVSVQADGVHIALVPLDRAG